MRKNLTLGPEDPTIFARCPRCSRKGVGARTATIYNAAFTRRKWKKNPVCPNCGSALEKLYEVK